jgi:cohesin complex subunit SCC1
MFYSNQILARKGPLGLVWIAAHMDGRLKRQQINSASIPASVDTLLDPEVPLALRLSGQLLLGVVRIYARKVCISTPWHAALVGSDWFLL